ncbi:MAG TPA: hypothetical protein VF807_03050 [Ktedonobacterales bacterium]
MIIRILGDNQYRLAEEHEAGIDALDDKLVDAVLANDPEAFTSSLKALLDYVRTHGTEVPPDELIASDGILPADDMTLAETRAAMEQSSLKMPTEHTEGKTV